MPRTVTLVLADPDGALLGALPSFTVDSPWWQEVAEVVAGAGIEVDVLRLLHADREHPPGGHVTYLAETRAHPDGLIPLGADPALHPRRAPWAVPGGPAASLAWAAGALDRLGLTGLTPLQMRTWNLSAIWAFLSPERSPVAWLKQVPSFYAHEPAVLSLVDEVAPGLVPYVMAAGGDGRMLLAHAPGEDRYGAGLDVCTAVMHAFAPVQEYFAGRIPELLTSGLPDHRLDAGRFACVAGPYLDGIPGLPELIDGLPARLAAAAECGLPDTLIHGDLHPGNVRTAPDGLVIVDWGDGGVGSPVFDVLRLTEDLDDPGPLVTAWAARWRAAVPGCEPERAVDLLRPVAALRGAVTYAGFLAEIEPAEWPYHSADVPGCLETAARLSGAV
ncbi:phosphotransferase [Actinoplanes sp. NPDC051851]|uniref:phosphotransferase family protein n=1 Tax=Actinoplanes sp. NPDC051851 TaxID=3154753 RepID=UPI0034150C0E